MLEHQLIQSTGFRNFGPDGARQGFAVRLRIPNYHGTRLSQMDGVDVTVDGNNVPTHPAGSIIVKGNYDFSLDGNLVQGTTSTEVPVSYTRPSELSYTPIPFIYDATDPANPADTWTSIGRIAFSHFRLRLSSHSAFVATFSCEMATLSLTARSAGAFAVPRVASDSCIA